jgi:serine/threonine protein kinase
MTTLEAIVKIEAATTASVLFGPEPEKTHKKLVLLIHPDRMGAAIKDRAQAALYKLNILYDSLNGKAHAPTPVVIGKWIVGDVLAKGDIADVYSAYPVADPKQIVAFKIARSPQDNDLIAAEHSSLKVLHADKRSDNFKRYLPQLLGTLEASGRRANILSFAEASYSLADIVTFYPKGLDFRHIVWMMSRGLSALGFAHSNKVIHGAILPEHLMYAPESHGLTLVDWCYSVHESGHIPAVVKKRANLYPAEVERKSQPSPATDIFMLAGTLKAAAGIPKRFRPLFEHCLAGSPRSRPQDAWELSEKWTALAKEEYGDPQFIKLAIPTQ